jgi:hypothetical protein
LIFHFYDRRLDGSEFSDKLKGHENSGRTAENPENVGLSTSNYQKLVGLLVRTYLERKALNKALPAFSARGGVF